MKSTLSPPLVSGLATFILFKITCVVFEIRHQMLKIVEGYAVTKAFQALRFWAPVVISAMPRFIKLSGFHGHLFHNQIITNEQLCKDSKRIVFSKSTPEWFSTNGSQTESGLASFIYNHLTTKTCVYFLFDKFRYFVSSLSSLFKPF